jgi:thioredoxin-like negative regulator of GroEL
VRTVAEKLAGTTAVVQVNTQENSLLPVRFAVRGIPVMVLIRNGKAVAELGGAQSAEAVIAWFRQHQAKSG